MSLLCFFFCFFEIINDKIISGFQNYNGDRKYCITNAKEGLYAVGYCVTLSGSNNLR